MYTAGYMVRTGHRHQLLDYEAQKHFQDSLVSPEAIALPFNHLAYEALLFAPYSLAPYKVAYFLFLISNASLLIWVVREIYRSTGTLINEFSWLPTALGFTFVPVAAALMQSQDSIVLLALICAAYRTIGAGKGYAAGLLLGLGAFKFQIILPIAAMYLLWKRWKFVAGVLSSALTVLAISLFLAGPSQMTLYLHDLVLMSAIETPAQQARFGINPAAMVNLRGLVHATLSHLLSVRSVQVLTAAASLVVFGWTILKGTKSLQEEHKFLLSISAAALVSYHLLVHDLSILVLPLIITLDHCIASTSKAAPVLISATLLLFASPAILALTPLGPFLLAIPLIIFWLAQTVYFGSRSPGHPLSNIS
jgi:hypothetical protein